jgi:GNAT superfamily N-acetyltransferase
LVVKVEAQMKLKKTLEWIAKAIRAGLRRLGLSWRTAILIERDLVQLPLPEAKTKVSAEIVIGTPAHIDMVRGILLDKWVDTYADRLNQGKIWLLGMVDGKVAYSTWITFQDEFEPNQGIWVRLSPGEAYFYNSYTIPQYESLGLHTALTAQRLAIARSRGAQRALGIVFADNLAARRVMISKLCFYEKEYITTISIFGWKFHHTVKPRGSHKEVLE